MTQTSATMDVDLESRIAYHAQQLHTATTPEARRDAWHELTRLHAMRSPDRIAAMEAEMMKRIR